MEVLKKSTKKQEEYAKAVKELSATDWFEKGVNFYESGNYKEALDTFSKAIELNPKAAGGYRGRGVVYAGLKNYQQAINDFSKAIELGPKDDAGAYYGRGISYLLLK